MGRLRKGDLVHIPQSVTLIGCDDDHGDPQLTIPLRVKETDAPSVGIITSLNKQSGYVRVFCEGDEWAVKSGNVYSLGTEND